MLWQILAMTKLKIKNKYSIWFVNGKMKNYKDKS